MSCKNTCEMRKTSRHQAGIAGIRIPLYHRSQSPRNWREINACQILVTWKFHQRCRI